MRRGLASLILGLSLLVASVAWSGFVMLHTILDPGRSERLADEMLDNTVLRGALVDAMADSIEAGLPGGATLPRQDVEAAAGVALDDPRVEAGVRDGIVRMHQNALNGVDEPVVIDPSVFGASARDALVGARPELDQVLPAVPPAAISLPDTGLSFLGDVRDFLERTVHLASLGALAGAAVALVVTNDRPSVLRRVALWAFAASAFWLILGYGVPWLAARVMPGSAAVFAAGVEVFLGAMILPALLLAGAGLVLVLLSILWDAVARPGRRSRARALDRDRPGAAPPYPPTAPGGRAAVPPARPSGTASAHSAARYDRHPAQPARSPDPADRTRVQPAAGSLWAPVPDRATSAPHGADPWDRTRVEGRLPSMGAGRWGEAGQGSAPQPAVVDPWDRTAADPGRPLEPDGGGRTDAHRAGRAPEPTRSAESEADRLRRSDGPRWVEGVGYVDG